MFDIYPAPTIRALIVVDMQRDFCEGGALPVPGAGLLGYHIANLMRQFQPGLGKYNFIVATKDWHLPSDDNGGHFSDEPDYVSSWPVHCVQGTDGAMLHPAVADAGVTRLDAIFYKGVGRPDYSGFQGETPTIFDPVGMLDYLTMRRVTDLDIVGVATEYCVKATAMDAVEHGFKVRVPSQLTAAVGGNEVKIETIKQIMQAQGQPTELIN